MGLVIADGWRKAFPGAVVGALAMHGVANPPEHPALRKRVQEVEAAILGRFVGVQPSDLASVSVIQAYRAHYKRFDKTYHVELQLESLLFKGKPLQSPTALVEAMFAAEVNNLLLTAGHDLDTVKGAVTVDASRGDERYIAMGGRQQVLKPGDMMMRDMMGIISCVLYGPDHRTRLTPDTKRALFTVYAPAGVGQEVVQRHLEEIAANVRLIAPQATVESLETYAA
jgi:DNA/RNA-binding domain of Phe-tRNA-synthetase-like protein